MSDDEFLEVFQSSESASKFNVHILKRDLILTFLQSTKGRMDFSVDCNGTPHGKVNVLSQHSIARLGGSIVIPKDEKTEFKTQMLRVGVILRDGSYIPAPELEIDGTDEEYEGLDSTLGSIDAKTTSEFLGNPSLIDRINEILHESREVPFIGDEANLMLTFLVMLSAKSNNPLNLEMVGQSASGKTYMTLTARNGFPKSMMMILAGASREALKYDYDEIDENGNFIVNVEGKCIVILEKDESYAFVRKMKPLMSGDDTELVWKTPIKNDMTGEIETRDFIIRGHPSFITLTTRNPKEQEQVTRQLLMTPDTTTLKVKSVVGNTLLAKARPEQFRVHPDLKLLQASTLSLNKYRVRNIFAPLMSDFFPARSAQHQRDIGKVLAIIDAITLLHQHQRPIEKLDDGEYLLSSVEDNLIGLILADLVLRASLSGVPDDSWRIFTEMSSMVEARKALTIDGILQWLHVNGRSTTKNSLQEKHLPTLEDAGLIEVAKRGGGRGGGRKTFRIVKARKGLMDNQALAPLFVESTRRELSNIITSFNDVLSRSEPPPFFRSLNPGEKKLLRSQGCVTKDESLIWRSLFLPVYFQSQSKDSMLWNIIGDSKIRKILFSGKAWLDVNIENTATEQHQDKQILRERVKKAISNDEAESDKWEQIVQDHMNQDYDL